MAINSSAKHLSGEKVAAKSRNYLTNDSKNRIITRKSYMNNNAVYSAAAEFNNSTANSKRTSRKSPYLSPYLTEDSGIHSGSQITDKTLVPKKSSIYSSFELANTVYTTNSSEFKTKKNHKKIKKSVLTLPNVPLPASQQCAVSDMNDSECFNIETNSAAKPKKKILPAKKRPACKRRKFDFYDRDQKYCFDCSSTDLIKLDGDRKGFKSKGSSHKNECNPHDVWAVLRNINRFQFRPSPPMSQDSFVPIKKKVIKRRNKKKNVRVVETHCKEEYAFISNFDVDDKSRNSSVDRVTVIGKRNELRDVCQQSESTLSKNMNIQEGPNKEVRRQYFNNKQLNNFKDKTVLRKHNSKNQEMFPCHNEQKPLVDQVMHYGNKTVAPAYNHNEGYHTPYGNLNKRRISVPVEYAHSINSGSSRAYSRNDTSGYESYKDRQFVKSVDTIIEANGITKVVLNDQTTAVPTPPSRIQLPKRKSQVNASKILPPRTFTPKPTRFEIRKNLALLRFPIVILGKDQLSSSYEVVAFDHLSGIDKNIWPFMCEWQGKEYCENEDTRIKDHRIKLRNTNTKVKKVQKVSNTPIVCKQSHFKDRKFTNEQKNCISNPDPKRVIPPYELCCQILPEKNKSVQKFKNKMLHLIYKKSATEHNRVCEKKLTDVTTETLLVPYEIPNEQALYIGTNTEGLNNTQKKLTVTNPIKSSNKVKHLSAKRLSTSELIDNVMNNIKKGVYYTVENNSHKTSTCATEAETQTFKFENDLNTVDMKPIAKITIKKKYDASGFIPGFEKQNLFPKVEITSLNMSEISIKHCTTNILVHFDVTKSSETGFNLQKTSSLVPLITSDSNTKIFRCKTSLVNSMLPAEICSILPIMITNIIESGCQLPTIPKLTHPILSKKDLILVPDEKKYENMSFSSLAMVPYVGVSPELSNLLDGSFKSRKKCLTEFRATKLPKLNCNRSLYGELIPNCKRYPLFNFEMNPTISICMTKSRQLLFMSPKSTENLRNTCTALQLYPAYDQRIVLSFKCSNFLEMLRKICRNSLNNQLRMTCPLTSFVRNNNQTFVVLKNSEDYKPSLSLHININLNSFDISNQFVDSKKRPVQIKKVFEKKSIQNSNLGNNKAKKSYGKSYKKCKSTSSIAGNKLSTPLNKIANLEDFFQALGPGKLLAGAFDSIGSRKILSSLVEMRNWTKELNPRQALLVLLLNNKKEFPNLLRYKPVLLQGIAVNRITQASELDMEIEVIERENLCRAARFEGISYLPESADIQDTLLEELCWIAKNTASDYKRIYDESSVKLLKSLLEKRKSLNPSYLRVMARYVGLGLLKSTRK